MTEPLHIGIACYPTYGGSGILATELGMELARRGHQIHFMCAEPPRRLDLHAPNVFLHEVKAPGYPLFRGDSQYTLALTSVMVDVAAKHRLDLFHVHYAVPHATAGWLAKQILGTSAPKLITTLHGTDITVVGTDPAFLPVTRFSIERSDGVTTPSRFLREATYSGLSVDRSTNIEVITNFVDTNHYCPPVAPPKQVLVHNSNFRALKRPGEVVRIFAELRRARDCELVLIGDGPERAATEKLAADLGVAKSVTFLGERLDFVDVLQRARVFLLPSESESFGLAALEAMSCGVPIVGSRIGGLPEVVADGECGFLAPVGDVVAMAAAAGRILDDDSLHARLSACARSTAVERFELRPTVDRYEAYYRKVLAK